MNIDYSFHSHTFRCNHASKDIEDYVIKAIEYGYKQYGVSDHVFLPGVQNPGTRGDYSLLDDYINEYHRVKNKYSKEIKMYLGFECEYSECFLDYYRYLLKERGFDYLICGQHMGFNSDYQAYGYFDGSIEGLIHYKNDLIKAMKCGLFMYIAHPDLFFVAATEYTPIHKDIIQDIINAAIKYDAVLELNIHGLFRNKDRHGYHYIDYPTEYFWKEVGKTNIKVVCGGDFHSPDEIGNMDNLKKIEAIIKNCNLNIININDVYNDYQKRIKSL